MWQYESHILQNLNLHFGVKSSDLCNINLWPLAVLQAINLWPQANLTEGKSHPVDNKREVCLGLSTHCNGCLVCVNFTDAARNEWERKVWREGKMISRNCTVQSCLHAERQWLFFSTFLLLLGCLTRGINSSKQSQALLECLIATFLVSFQSFQQTVCFSHMGIIHFTCLKQGQFCKLGFCQIAPQSRASCGVLSLATTMANLSCSLSRLVDNVPGVVKFCQGNKTSNSNKGFLILSSKYKTKKPLHELPNRSWKQWMLPQQSS